MASVEGMWKFQSGDLGDREKPRWGGIVVMESGKVFGGDSVMAYLGTYEVDRGKITADVRSWNWNTDLPADEVINVFGMEGPIDYQVRLEGDVTEGAINGAIWPVEQPDFKLRARMEKIAELP
jgi:hypothetical protein